MNTSVLIKEIRKNIGLSQVEFSKKVHVSFSTVNRWENARAVPNPIAVEMMITLCERENVNPDFLAALRTLRG